MTELEDLSNELNEEVENTFDLSNEVHEEILDSNTEIITLDQNVLAVGEFNEFAHSGSNPDLQIYSGNNNNDNKDLDDVSSGNEDVQEETSQNNFNKDIINPSKPNEDFEGFKRGEHSEKVMNDIFGDSDEEDFEGFNENEIEKETQNNNELEEAKDTSDAVPLIASDVLKPENSGDIMQCFESVMEKQRVERRLNRPKRRTDVEFLNDLDDKVSDLMNKMRLAAIEDEELYHLGLPGIKKMLLLPSVKDLLRRSNVKEVLIEAKFLNIMAAWMKALPNQVLPPLDIRRTMLTALREFPSLSSDVLRESKIGKAVMYLLQHPKETVENKRIAKMLINEWSRNVFKLSSNYKGMTREERLERDRAISNRRKLVDQDASTTKKESRTDDGDNGDGAGAASRPGEKNWIPRATVPKPSNKDYIIRPNWRVKNSNLKRENRDDEDDYDYEDEDEEELMNRMRPTLEKRMRLGQKESSNTTLFEKTYRRIKQSCKGQNTILRASKISIQGRGMNS